jgi:hypothetical protein
LTEQLAKCQRHGRLLVALHRPLLVSLDTTHHCCLLNIGMEVRGVFFLQARHIQLITLLLLAVVVAVEKIFLLVLAVGEARVDF